MSLLKKLFGDYSTKEIKRISGTKDKVLALENAVGRTASGKNARI